MARIVDVEGASADLRMFLEDYASAVRDFGESVPQSWADDKPAGLRKGDEFCIGLEAGNILRGILWYSYSGGRGNAFVCWRKEEVDREGLLQLITEYCRRSPAEMKLRINGVHPNIDFELMSAVCEAAGFKTKKRFEMITALDRRVGRMKLAGDYETVPITKCDESALSMLDWLGYEGTPDQFLFFENREENRKLIRSLLEGDYGPVLNDASLAIVRDEGPAAMIAVTDMGDMAFLADIVVSKELRGRGIGRYLLVRAMKACIRLKKRSMLLWVSDWNTNAMALYKSLGFRPSRTGIYYFRESSG